VKIRLICAIPGAPVLPVEVGIAEVSVVVVTGGRVTGTVVLGGACVVGTWELGRHLVFGYLS